MNTIQVLFQHLYLILLDLYEVRHLQNFLLAGEAHANALSGFVKKVDRSVKTTSITTADELRQAIEELGR